MVTNFQCDVLVVGAGPAGAVCAAKLAKEGFEVICVDKEKKPGQAHTPKIDITENKGIEEIIKELKLDYLAKTNKSLWFSPKDKFTFVSSIHDLFFLRGTSQDSLDYSLFLAMEDNNVDVWLDSKPIKLNMAFDKVESVLIQKKNKKVLVKPKLVVVATGEDSFFYKNLGITERDKTTIVGFGALMSNLSMEDKTTNIFFDANYAPGGYFFTGRVSKGIGIAMIVANKAKLKQPIKKSFYDFIKKNSEVYGVMLGAEPIEYNFGERTISRVSKNVVGNVALCGDSARTMSPIFAYGVNPAIRSGYLLAEKIIKHKLGETALIEYEKELKKQFKTSYQDLVLRKVYDNLSNADFDFLVDTANYLHSKQHLDKLVDTDEYKIEHLLKALLRKPGKTILLAVKGLACFFKSS
ncbi:MAG: NAD(P)/FAD-dependent oxidoreductase [archaeon]